MSNFRQSTGALSAKWRVAESVDALSTERPTQGARKALGRAPTNDCGDDDLLRVTTQCTRSSTSHPPEKELLQGDFLNPCCHYEVTSTLISQPTRASYAYALAARV